MSAQPVDGPPATPAVDAESLQPRPGADAADADPSLEGIPLEVVENVGAYDTDTAGGCG